MPVVVLEALSASGTGLDVCVASAKVPEANPNRNKKVVLLISSTELLDVSGKHIDVSTPLLQQPVYRQPRPLTDHSVIERHTAISKQRYQSVADCP